MAILNTMTALDNMKWFDDLGYYVDQSNLFVGDSIDRAFDLLSGAGSGRTGTLYNYQSTTSSFNKYAEQGYSGTVDGPAYRLTLTGSGFSRSIIPSEAASGLLDTDDQNFTINTFNAELMSSLYAEGLLGRVYFNGSLRVVDGELVDSFFDELLISMPNGMNISFNGRIVYDGLNLVGNDIRMYFQVDSDPSAGPPAMASVELVMDLNLSLIDGYSGVVKSVKIHDPNQGGYFELTGMSIELSEIAASVSFEDLMMRVGNGVSDTVNSASSFSLSAGFENLNLLEVGGNARGIGNSLNNKIIGNSFNNALSGDAGLDSLVGGFGNDTLSGGGDNDYLEGGDGNDFWLDLSWLNTAALSIQF